MTKTKTTPTFRQVDAADVASIQAGIDKHAEVLTRLADVKARLERSPLYKSFQEITREETTARMHLDLAVQKAAIDQDIDLDHEILSTDGTIYPTKAAMIEAGGEPMQIPDVQRVASMVRRMKLVR